MKITNARCAYEPERFLKSFGFKGKTLSGVWQVYVLLASGNETGIGVGVQSVLWSDSAVFAKYGEEESNQMMFKVTKRAVELASGKEFETPKSLIDELFDELYDYACEVTNMKVTETFVLNALVAVDFAAWQLYSKLNGYKNFDQIYSGVCKNDYLANIPLITYGVPVERVKEMAKSGTCLFKIKLGQDPDGDGDLQKMLEWDKKRMLEIHKALKDVETPYTESGKPLYYFDANGRYDTYERLKNLVDFMVETGISERTAIFEEPFAPENEIFLGDLPINFAADESAHSLKDVKRRIELGYKTITLKPIAKTLSVSIEMANCAKESKVQCFCADLTVNPYMVEWNKNVAARLNPLKGMKIGVVESNGAENYVNWQKMKDILSVPFKDETVYDLTKGFYKHAGGVFEAPEYYKEYLLK